LLVAEEDVHRDRIHERDVLEPQTLDGWAEQVLLAADRACYVAKSTGRNRATTASEAIAVAGMVFPSGPTPFDNPDVVAANPN